MLGHSVVEDDVILRLACPGVDSELRASLSHVPLQLARQQCTQSRILDENMGNPQDSPPHPEGLSHLSDTPPPRSSFPCGSSRQLPQSAPAKVSHQRESAASPNDSCVPCAPPTSPAVQVVPSHEAVHAAPSAGVTIKVSGRRKRREREGDWAGLRGEEEDEEDLMLDLSGAGIPSRFGNRQWVPQKGGSQSLVRMSI